MGHVENRIGITLDVDWVEDYILEYVIALLKEHGAKATFFSTHDSSFLKSLPSDKYEVGIHPNFSRDEEYSDTILKLKSLYPASKGVRSHGLFQSSRILKLFLDHGLKYDVNTHIPLREGLYPFIRLNKLICIPFYWEDDSHFSAQRPFDLEELAIYKPGLKIYNFHPVHIYMNTQSMPHYESFKPYQKQRGLLETYRYPDKGTRTLFIKLLEIIQNDHLTTYKCHEIYEQYALEAGIV